ncbi:LysR family transcriptional regulator [Aromatoleum toluvorans]|uniref:LysR family transcriptional regulator n=1 Tax=Aromatoleum toluvorans TaxID=92002 RepID=A0ABX1Q339_9RHOO|nr:LysR family transcriptional regulator [Aromatoleum toluvorans]NMG46139.1 LysR family transcriptional regulator [Aromatoleum toluvorans]
MTTCPPLDLMQSWVAVVEFESVSRAAVHLGVSQAAVSQHVQALEESIGISLLDRTFRPARPTPAGLRLYDDACRLLEQANQIVVNARNVARAKGTTVRIGCVDSFAATICPQLVKGLSSSSSKITLWSGITPVLDEQMNTRQIDVAITTMGATKRTGITRQRLFSENYFVVLPRRFPRQETEDVAQLAKRLQFIRYSLRSKIGEQIQAYFDGIGVELERSFEFDATDPLLSLVAAGLGWALITPLCLWQSRHHLPDVTVLPLNTLHYGRKICPPLERTFYMLWRRDELGSIPNDIRNIVSEVAQRQLAPDIARIIGIPEEALFTFPATGPGTSQ